MAHYTKKKPSGDIYHGHDRSDAEPGFYQVPDWQIRAIIKALRAGEMTHRAIAYEFNVQERTVTRYARMAGIPPKRNVPRMTREQAAYIHLHMWNQDTTMRTIVAYLGGDYSRHTHAFRGLLTTLLGVDPGKKPRYRKPKPPQPVKPRKTRKYYRELLRGWHLGLANKTMTLDSIAAESGYTKKQVQDGLKHNRNRHPDWFVDLPDYDSRTKLDASAAAEIRAERNTPARELGARYGVHEDTIRAIWRGKVWA